MPLSDQAAVESEDAKWASLCLVDQAYEEPAFDIPPEQLELMMPTALKAAVMTFPADTGLGKDNVSPRALARLSNGALAALGKLFATFEMLDSWCEVFNLVLIILLPESDRGLRPIGLFPTITRVWMRSRILGAKAWETITAVPTIFGGPGMGAQAAAYQVAFVAEAAVLKSMVYAAGLLGLVKAFESVPHAVLAKLAVAKGYPPVLLRLCLASYRLKRTIGVEGVFSKTVIATRGITAGVGFAALELRLLLLDCMALLDVTWGVDDLTLAVYGEARMVIDVLSAALDLVLDHFQVAIKMEVSKTKSVVISSLPSVGTAIVDAVSSRVLKAVSHTKLLGADHAGGAKRSTLHQRQRLTAFNDMRDAFLSLRTVGADVHQMTRAVGPAKTMYSVEHYGMADTALKDNRASMAASASSDTAGRDIDTRLHIIDGPHGTLDTAFDAHALPAKYWALAVWQAWFPVPQLEEAVALARKRIDNCNISAWTIVSGPTSALIASFARIGWRLLSATLAMHDVGWTWNFARDPPAAIVKSVYATVKRWRLDRIVKYLPGIIPAVPDWRGPGLEPQMTVLNITPAIANLHRGKKVPRKTSTTWKLESASSLRSASNGGQWTQTRKAVAYGLEDCRCQLCFLEHGTLAHRWSCQRTAPRNGHDDPPKEANHFECLLQEDRNGF